MVQQVEGDQPAAVEEGGPIPSLNGSFALTELGGSLAWSPVGQSPAGVEWVQGSPAMGKAEFRLDPANRPPSQPPPPQITNLAAGTNSISFAGEWDTAQVHWLYSNGSGEATFVSKMGGLPVGPSGWNTVAEVAGPREGNCRIAFASEPTTCLLDLLVETVPANVGPLIVRVCVDDVYTASLPDRSQIVIRGEVVTLGVDIRFADITAIMVVYRLQYQ